MPLPDRLARVNRRLTNPFMRTFAGRLPPFAIVLHRGHRTGRDHRTPVWAFPTPGGFVVALTYDPDRDWVRNTFAHGGCTLLRAGRHVPLADPTILHGAAGLQLMPRPLRPVLRLLGVTAFLRLRLDVRHAGTAADR